MKMNFKVTNKVTTKFCSDLFKAGRPPKRAQLWGPMPINHLDIALRKKAEIDIFVDGGICHYHGRSKSLELWIGDSDSLKKKLPAAILESNRFYLNTRKSYSDLEAALKLLPNHEGLIIEAFGFLGGRKDHEYINVGCASKMLAKRKWKMINFWNSKNQNNDIKSIHILNKSINHSFKSINPFSIFSYKNQTVHLSGKMDYCGKINLPALSSLGLSNQGCGTFQIKPTSVLSLFLC
jgi:thiamine pyrophosphokinase